MPPLRLLLTLCLLSVTALPAACQAADVPATGKAPRLTDARSPHFWRKREIEEISRRIIERELGYADAPRYIVAADGGDAGSTYRFRLAPPPRHGLALPTPAVSFVVSGDLASGRVVSICHQRDGRWQGCRSPRAQIRS
ncbi:hypothetical protein ACPRNU_09615 [Chromobacterium vaccinii]|uniref:hypothetical protein n=1 Tax=Chromobacterium TaxID=535 RepID=UPI001305108D|nr:hypothetical protein [Chromobacterium sp. ATCC 53434]